MSGKGYETAEITLIGNRSINQDRCLILESSSTVMLVVADGLGGHPKGEAAAQILVDTCRDIFKITPKPVADPRKCLQLIIRQAHRNILGYGSGQQPAIDPRTTAVIALVQQGMATSGHVGDSRFYRLRDGRIVNQSIDHSYVQHLRAQGLISPTDCDTHPYRNYVTRCVGGFDTAPEPTLGPPMPLQGGDTLLLCSDGLWGAFGSQYIAQALADPVRPLIVTLPEIAREAAQAQDPNSDNVTAVALRWLAPTWRDERE